MLFYLQANRLAYKQLACHSFFHMYVYVYFCVCAFSVVQRSGIHIYFSQRILSMVKMVIHVPIPHKATQWGPCTGMYRGFSTTGEKPKLLRLEIALDSWDSHSYPLGRDRTLCLMPTDLSGGERNISDFKKYLWMRGETCLWV